MLSGDGKENSLKISLSVIKRKNNFARGAHFVVLHDYLQKLPETF